MLNRLLHECFDLFHNREDRAAIDTATAEETIPLATPGEGARTAPAAATISVNNVSASSGGTASLNVTNDNRTITSVNNNHYGSGVASSRPNPPNILLPTGCNTARDKDGNNTNPSTTPAEKKVVPKKGVYTADSHGRIILPHDLIQPHAKDITKEHCAEYFECYPHFNRHELCLEEVKKIVQAAGSASKAIDNLLMTSARVENFQRILLSIRSDLMKEGTRLFKNECCNRFNQRGMKVKDSCQGPRSFTDCKAIISGSISSQLKESRFQTCPAIVAHQCVDAVTAKIGKDPFFFRLKAALLKLGMKHQTPFTFGSKGGNPDPAKREKTVTHNAIMTAKRGFNDPKKGFQLAVMSALNMAVRSNKPKENKDQLVIKLREVVTGHVVASLAEDDDEEEEEGEGEEVEGDGSKKKKKKKKKEDTGGPYLLVKKSLFGPLASTITPEQAKKLIQMDDSSRMLHEVAEALRAKGTFRTEAVSRFSRVFDELDGVVGAAPPLEDPLYFYQDPSHVAPQVDRADPTNTLGKQKSPPVDKAEKEFCQNFRNFGFFFIIIVTLSCLPRGSSRSSLLMGRVQVANPGRVHLVSSSPSLALLATTTTKATSTNIATKFITVAIPGRVQVANPGRVHSVSSSPSLVRCVANLWRVH